MHQNGAIGYYMKTQEQAMQEAFDELMGMSEEDLKAHIKGAIDNPGVFSKMALDEFFPSLIEEIRNQNENS